MIKILITFFFASITQICYSQKTSPQTADGPIKALYILKPYNKPPIATENLIISAIDIDSLTDITIQSRELSKLLKITLVFVLKPRQDIVFYSLDQLLSLYHITRQDQNLIIKVDNYNIDYPETLLADENEILNVEIDKSTEFPFINIKTRHPYIKPKHSKGTIIIH
jgi:hypothetical protein